MKKTTLFLIALLCMFAIAETASALTYNVVVPEGTKACYITGDMNGWSTSAAPMTKVDDTHYTIDLPDATTSQKYQYLSGPDWKYIEKDADGNAIQDRTWSEQDVVVQWLTTFVPDERDVTIEALVPTAVEELYLVGSFNSWASPTADTKMTLLESTVDGKVFSISVHSADAKNMEFKFCAGHSWSYQQTSPTANFVYETTENTKSVVVETFQAIYEASKAGTINIKATVPAGTSQVFLQGDFLGYNMANALEGTKNEDGTFSFSIPNEYIIEYRLYNKADWSYPEVGDDGKERANRKAIYPDDANAEITVINWMNVVAGTKMIKDADNKIYCSQKSIIVEDVKNAVELYDLSGHIVDSAIITGTFSSKTLTPGFYIVKVDGKIKKVVNK